MKEKTTAPVETEAARAEPVETVPVVTIPLQQARQMLELYRNIEAADAHFMRCQSDLFRSHMKGVYQAPLVAGAFAFLEKAVSEAS